MKILFEKINIMTEPVISEGYLGVIDGKISYIGAEKPEGYEDARIIPGNKKAIMPGFINTHVHVPMTPLRGYANDYDLDTWLTKYIFPAEDKLDARCVAAGAELGIAEMIASGTTSFSDSYFFSEEVAKIAAKSGIKANIARSVTNFNNEVKLNEFYSTCEAVSLYNDWNGYDDGRIKIDTAIHAEYTTSESLWRELGAYAREVGAIMQIHISETEHEHKECISRYGKTPIQVFYDAGVLDAKTVAAHCVWVDDADMQIMKKCGVSVAHNPVSNLKLASGVAPICTMLERGINVALGTDGVASNNSFDMFEELKLSAILHKGVNRNPTCITASQAFKMATVNGAIAQGRETTGEIKVGFDADLVVLDLDKPHLMPCHNLMSNIVYSARGADVCMTMVRGNILYENGEFKTLDVEKAEYEMKNYVFPKMF